MLYIQMILRLNIGNDGSFYWWVSDRPYGGIMSVYWMFCADLDIISCVVQHSLWGTSVIMHLSIFVTWCVVLWPPQLAWKHKCPVGFCYHFNYTTQAPVQKLSCWNSWKTWVCGKHFATKQSLAFWFCLFCLCRKGLVKFIY